MPELRTQPSSHSNRGCAGAREEYAAAAPREKSYASRARRSAREFRNQNSVRLRSGPRQQVGPENMSRNPWAQGCHSAAEHEVPNSCNTKSTQKTRWEIQTRRNFLPKRVFQAARAAEASAFPHWRCAPKKRARQQDRNIQQNETCHKQSIRAKSPLRANCAPESRLPHYQNQSGDIRQRSMPGTHAEVRDCSVTTHRK